MLTKYAQESIPAWAFEHMMLECPHCERPIMQNESLTARWCPNPECPGHMAYKLVDLAQHFHIKGIGPATALNLIKGKKFSSHFDIMSYWFPDNPPTATLAEIASLAGIDGYGMTQAEKELSQYASFEDYFENAPTINELLWKNRMLLCKAETYFSVLPPMSSDKILVMGTGSFHGFQSRDEYFQVVNYLFGEHIHVIQTGKRKTGVSFLIKEKDAVDHSKSAIAAECHIPVVTPLEFIHILSTAFHISIEEIKQKGESLPQ